MGKRSKRKKDKRRRQDKYFKNTNKKELGISNVDNTKVDNVNTFYTLPLSLMSVIKYNTRFTVYEVHFVLNKLLGNVAATCFFLKECQRSGLYFVPRVDSSFNNILLKIPPEILNFKNEK